MKHGFNHWDEIAERVRQAPSLFISLDYDGVLSPIAARPRLAKLSAHNRRLLEQLVHHRGFVVAIVSGRELGDLQERVGLSPLIYAGNHGAEIQIQGKTENHIPIQSYRDELVRVLEELMGLAEEFPGAHVEDKGFGIGIHYREVARQKVKAFKRRFQHWAKHLPQDLIVKPAKMMFEVRPNVKWDKGTAVLRIWQAVAPEALPICMGDDKTDEDGFIALKGRGINVFVGKTDDSAAEYYLKSPKEVSQFLKRLIRLPVRDGVGRTTKDAVSGSDSRVEPAPGFPRPSRGN